MTDVVAAWRPAGPSGVQARAAPVAGAERPALVLAAAAIVLLPVLSPGGPANIAPVDVPIAMAAWACLVWAGGAGRRLRFPYVVPMVLFMTGGALGAVAGPVPRDGAVTLVQDVVLVVWCWTVVNLGSSPERLRTLTTAWVYGALGWVAVLTIGLILGLPELTGQTESEGSRTSLTFLDPNFAASYWFISIMLIWATGLPRHRGVRVLAYILLVVALVSTGSNSGMVSLLVGVSVASILSCHRRYGIAPAALLAAAVLLGGYLTTLSIDDAQQAAGSSQYRFLRDGIGRSESSVAQRSALMGESMRLYREGGPLGQGPVSTKARLKAELAPYVKEAHDDYLAALIERGVLGFLALMLLLGAVLTRTAPLVSGRLAAGFAAAVPRSHVLVGAVVGLLAAMAVNELLHVRHVWTLFAFVAALHAWGRRA